VRTSRFVFLGFWFGLQDMQDLPRRAGPRTVHRQLFALAALALAALRYEPRLLLFVDELMLVDAEHLSIESTLPCLGNTSFSLIFPTSA
jgi:hypothetical protein